MAVLIRVYGDVQGVGFRMLIKRWAEEMSLKGYGRNLPDGSVEIFVEGPEHIVEMFIERIKSEAPTEIIEMRVDRVSSRGYERFYIIP